MANLNEYKCRKCGGALQFDANSKKLICLYCDSAFEPYEFVDVDSSLGSGYDEDQGFLTEVSNTWADGETDGLCSYICKSCGGEIIGDSTMASTSCPYCGNPVVVMGAFTGMLKPDYIVPFKFDKAQAMKALQNHFVGKALLPKVFKEESKIQEVKGIYVPYWIFNTNTYGNYKYSAEKDETWSDSKYRYKKTSYYKLYRFGELNFKGIPINGSGKIDDRLMESLEPFDINRAIPFQTAYLAGYFADKYDVETQVGWERTKERIANTAEVCFSKTVSGFTRVRQESGSVTFNDKHADYALLPVWLLTTVWKGET